MDNMVILQHIGEKELKKDGRRVSGFFISLKAAFDKVKRKIHGKYVKSLRRKEK